MTNQPDPAGSMRPASPIDILGVGSVAIDDLLTATLFGSG